MKPENMPAGAGWEPSKDHSPLVPVLRSVPPDIVTELIVSAKAEKSRLPLVIVMEEVSAIWWEAEKARDKQKSGKVRAPALFMTDRANLPEFPTVEKNCDHKGQPTVIDVRPNAGASSRSNPTMVI